MTHTISSLCDRSHEISKSKGWLDNPRPFHTLCLLMHTEVAEAVEDWRNNHKPDEIYYEHDHKKFTKEQVATWQGIPAEEIKPCGIPIEFADVIIRIAQWAGTAGIGHKLDDEVGHLLRSSRLYNDDVEEALAWVHVDIAKATALEWDLRTGMADHKRIDRADTHPSVIAYLAQAMWRLFALSRAHGIDIWAAIDEKEAFNKTRPARHGGKKI